MLHNEQLQRGSEKNFNDTRNVSSFNDPNLSTMPQPSSSYSPPYSSALTNVLPNYHYSTLEPQVHPSAPLAMAEEKVDNFNADLNAKLKKIKLNDVIRLSTLCDANPMVQTKKIVDEFNHGNKEDFTLESIPFGKRIDTNEIRLVHRNNVPQLVPYTPRPRRLGVYATGVTEEIGVYKQTDLCVGAHGRYLVNVPQGKLVKAWEGINPIFLGEGPHVIRHQNFQLDKSPLVDLSQNVITHGNYAMIRVPRGKLAKISLNGMPYLLESSPEPYVFNDPTFQLVQHKVGDKLESFANASEECIVHGSITRLLPRTGSVAITYDNGKLITIGATGQPYIVDSPTFTVDGFLQVNRQTLLLPSEKEQEERRKKNPKDENAIAYEIFRTSDNLPVGVKVLVAYEIEKPQLTLTALPKDEIQRHIENVVVAHIGSIVQSCSSSDFQKTGQNAVEEFNKQDWSDYLSIFQAPSQSSPFYSQMQKDTKPLAEDLLKIGIRLTQLRVEPPKILDEKIAAEMAQNSLLNAKARAEVSVLDLNLQIKQQQATQASEQQRIQTDREKLNKIAQAEWEGEAITIKAKAELEAAKLRAEAVRIEYEAKVECMRLENEAQITNMEKRAKLFDTYPGLLSLELTRVQAEAMRGIQSIVSPEIAATWFSTPGIGLFSGRARNASILPMSPRIEQTVKPQPDVSPLIDQLPAKVASLN
ncbi:MAG: hypothetical protein KIT56_04935 [Gammaproteobacteria bacterium]|nr:hypothetical protein [Gammaproteobacteria bacterium]MCW5583223.1 hypothetical protein [Gammaproteobacteria bacterium]